MLKARCALAAVLGGTLAIGGPSALGATPSTPYQLDLIDAPSPQLRGQWGERHAAANDLNGDGVNDYFISAPVHDVRGPAPDPATSPPVLVNAGRVWAINGRTRSILYTLVSPELQRGQFGFFISVLGDVNGDGKDDLAVGAPAQNVTAAGASCPGGAGCNTRQGKAWVFSGATGTPLYALNNPDPQDQADFGGRIGRAGDIDGDGKPDVIVAAPGEDVPVGCSTGFTTGPPGCRIRQGRAFIFSGATGALIRRLDLPTEDRIPSDSCMRSNCGSFGIAVQGPGDVNGDGVTDQLVTAGGYNYSTSTPVGAPCDQDAADCNEGQGRMYLFSGADGALLAKIDDPVPQAQAIFGFQDAAPLAPGDVNGDGRADLYGNGFTQHGPDAEAQGRAWVFDGKATVENPSAHGVVLYEPKDPTPTRGGQFGWSLDKTDYNKDRRPNLYIGSAPHHLANGDESGGTYVFNGINGSLLKSLELPPSLAQSEVGTSGNTGSNLGWSIAAVGDLNQDDEPDYAAGAPFQDVGDNIDQGLAVVFLSQVPVTASPLGQGPLADCPPSVALRTVIALTSANDTRNGTPNADRIFAGAGDDIVDGLAGDDCIDLGPGTDRGQGGEGADLLVGGLGEDRLAGSAGADRLRGGSSRDHLNGGFGSDRLHGQSGADRILGERGRDLINGGSSSDRIAGGSWGDRIAGDQGNDRITGNSGNDVVKGNSGRDRLKGSSGRDRLSGGSGNDYINANDGQRDRVNCGSGRDRVIADPIDRVARNCERIRRH